MERSLHKKFCNIAVQVLFETVPELQNYNKTPLQSEPYPDFSSKLPQKTSEELLQTIQLKIILVT